MDMFEISQHLLLRRILTSWFKSGLNLIQIDNLYVRRLATMSPPLPLCLPKLSILGCAVFIDKNLYQDKAITVSARSGLFPAWRLPVAAGHPLVSVLCSTMGFCTHSKSRLSLVYFFSVL